jgi:hypothetical protein
VKRPATAQVTGERRRQRASGRDATIAIAPAEPDAGTAAEPSLVPGTTYEYTAPRTAGARAGADPDRLAARRRGAPRRRCRAAPASWRCPRAGFPPTDLLSSIRTNLLAPGCRTSGSTATSARNRPRPACLKITTVEYGNPNPFDGVPATKKSLCAPAADLVAVPGDQICPRATAR